MNTCQPLSQWVEKDEDGKCKPCGIAALVGDYQSLLEQNGLNDKSDAISRALLDNKDPVLAVAHMMDAIKSEVTPDLRTILEEKDCEAQQAVDNEAE